MPKALSWRASCPPRRAWRCAVGRQHLEDLSVLRDSPAPQQLKAMLLANLPFLKFAVDLSHIRNAPLSDVLELGASAARSIQALPACLAHRPWLRPEHCLQFLITVSRWPSLRTDRARLLNRSLSRRSFTQQQRAPARSPASDSPACARPTCTRRAVNRAMRAAMSPASILSGPCLCQAGSAGNQGD